MAYNYFDQKTAQDQSLEGTCIHRRHLSCDKSAFVIALRCASEKRHRIMRDPVAMHPLITGRHSIHYLPINRRAIGARAPPTEMRTQIRDCPGAKFTHRALNANV